MLIWKVLPGGPKYRGGGGQGSFGKVPKLDSAIIAK